MELSISGESGADILGHEDILKKPTYHLHTLQEHWQLQQLSLVQRKVLPRHLLKRSMALKEICPEGSLLKRPERPERK